MNFNKEYYNVLYLLFAILVRIAAGSCRERLTLIYLVAPYNLPFMILPHRIAFSQILGTVNFFQ